MPKLCVIYNMAPKYREPIFRLMDKEMDIDWYFGAPIGDIKGLNPQSLKNADIIGRRTWKGLTWQKGILKYLKNKNYRGYILTGEPFTLSTWVFMILRPLVAPKKKIFLWSHGWYGRESFAKKWIKRVFFGLADGTFLYGNFARTKAIEQGNDPDKLWVIHNSLDNGCHKELRAGLENSSIYKDYFKNDNPTLIFIGRLTKVKKLHQFIEAVSKLKQRNENYNVVFVGDGEEKLNLEQLANRLEVSVWFYGSSYDETKNAELIYNADLCVSPGNVGLTAIHSMTFGTPVITHSNFPNQMPEFEAIHEGETGSFFMEDSIESLAKCISKWFSMPDYSRETIRYNCQNEIDNFWTPIYQIGILQKYLSQSLNI